MASTLFSGFLFPLPGESFPDPETPGLTPGHVSVIVQQRGDFPALEITPGESFPVPAKPGLNLQTASEIAQQNEDVLTMESTTPSPLKATADAPVEIRHASFRPEGMRDGTKHELFETLILAGRK